MNIVQMENRMKGVPDEALRQMLIQMTQTGQVGTPEYLLAAGEIQSRKDARQKASIGQGNQTPVIAELITGGAMPPMPQQQMAPAEAGIAAMRAPSAEQEFAAGGLVAFRDGGVTLSDAQEKLILERAAALGLNPDYVLGAVKSSPADKVQTLFDDLGMRSVGKTDVPAMASKVAAPVTAPASISLSDVMRMATIGEQKQYQQTGQLPQRLQGMLTGQTPLPETPTGPGRATELFTSTPGGVQTTPMGQTPSGGLMQFYPGMPALTQAPNVRVSQTDPGYIPPEGLAAQRASVQNLKPVTPAVVPSPQTPPADGDKPSVQRIDQPESKKPAAGLPAIDANGIMGIAKQFAGKAPDEIRTTDKQAVEDQFKLYKEMGVDLDPYKKIKERLAGAESEYEKQKNEAGLMALAQFGFNWASTAGPTLAAAAKAGKEVMPGVMESLKDLRKLKREDEKLGAEIAAFDSRMRKDITDKARSELQAKKNRNQDRRDAINDNAAKIAGTIYGQQLASQTSITTTEMTTEATIARLNQQLGETQTKNIVDAATKLVTGDPRYALAKPTEKDTMLNNAIQQVLRARLAASTTVTKTTP